MREILFRGKRTDNGEWIEGYYAKQSNHACFAHELKYQHFIFKDVCLDFNLGGLQEFEIIPETVGQYTGLTDKNGVRIFEGDILRGFEYPFCSNINGEFNYFAEIVWFDDSSAFGIYTFKNPKSNVRGISEGNTDYLEYFNVDKWEIIGNIHDNPELLEGGGGNG